MKNGGRSELNGFTLIELSIVLVIIGLLVGGVLVGQDLIRAAGVRSTISQIERYQTAVNTFQAKYDALPGDMNSATASKFGFSARGPSWGQGDGNGVIEGNIANSNGGAWGASNFVGETAMFWVDLTWANGLNLNLVEGSFSTASFTVSPATVSATAMGKYFPPGKIGRGSSIYVWSGGSPAWGQFGMAPSGDRNNYFGITVVNNYSQGACGGQLPSSMPLSVKEAYDIDRKIDDALPQSGRVTAMYSGCISYWASGGPVDPVMGETSDPPHTIQGPSTAATLPTPITCYDNGGINGTAQKYSLAQNGGAGVNCALSFQLQ